MLENSDGGNVVAVKMSPFGWYYSLWLKMSTFLPPWWGFNAAHFEEQSLSETPVALKMKRFR